MTDTYIAARPIVMHGICYAVGETINPAKVDPQRITAGLAGGWIRKAPPPEAPPHPEAPTEQPTPKRASTTSGGGGAKGGK